MKKNLFMSVAMILASYAVQALPTKTITMVGTLVNPPTVTSGSGVRVTTIDCALVSYNVCATIVIHNEYVLPLEDPGTYDVGEDNILQGSVIHISAGSVNLAGIVQSATQTTVSNITNTQIITEEIDYTSFPAAPVKCVDVLGYYIESNTSDIFVERLGVPGKRTVIKCALVSTSVCYTITTADLGIPATVNEQTHNGPLPTGYYRMITANGVDYPGIYVSHTQVFALPSITERNHILEYVPVYIIPE